MDSTAELLKERTEAHGVPGYETPIRAIVRKSMVSLGEISHDEAAGQACWLDSSAPDRKSLSVRDRSRTHDLIAATETVR